MIAVMEKTVTRPVADKPPLPREHGAWGILLVPFATAVGVTGVFDLKVGLLLASVLCFYIARTSFLKKQFRWMIILLAGSVAGAAPLLLHWKLWWLVGFGAVAAAPALRPTARSTAGQLAAMFGLTLTAPAAWYVATGRLDWPAGRLWLLNTLYFAGGMLYVKMHMAAAIRRRPFASLSERMHFGSGVLTYHGFLIVAGIVAWPALLAFAPAVIRAAAGVWRLSPALRIKRLGWTEVAYSIGFAVVIIAILR
jgi:hypothetical protein